MSDSITVKSAADGALLLYSKTTGHLLQKLPSPSKYIRNKVTISSGSKKSKQLTAGAKKKLIQQIRESGRDIAVVLPVLDILPDAALVASNLLNRRSGRNGVLFHEKWGSESGSATASESTEISGPIILLDGDSSDASSLATASWTPSEQAHTDRVRTEKKKQKVHKTAKNRQMPDRTVRRVMPQRGMKTAARKRLKRRKGRVYDF